MDKSDFVSSRDDYAILFPFLYTILRTGEKIPAPWRRLSSLCKKNLVAVDPRRLDSLRHAFRHLFTTSQTKCARRRTGNGVHADRYFS